MCKSVIYVITQILLFCWKSKCFFYDGRWSFSAMFKTSMNIIAVFLKLLHRSAKHVAHGGKFWNTTICKHRLVSIVQVYVEWVYNMIMWDFSLSQAKYWVWYRPCWTPR